MGVERYFLGWDRPLPDLAVARLTSGWESGALDLRGWLVLLPTRQSGRRLREALLAWAAARGVGVLPPEMVTPDRLLRRRENDRLVPNRAEELLVWTAVLRESESGGRLAALFPRPLRELSEPRGLVGMARRMSGLRRQLAESGLAVGDCVEHPAVAAEQERWRDLARLEAAYVRRLAAAGRKDGLAAMREAVARPEIPAGTRQVLVIGVPDPLPLAVAALATAAKHLSVAIWIHAPAALADAFDPWGRPCPETWEKTDIGLADKSLRVADNPREEAAEVVRALAETANPATGRSGAVAVLREELFPPVEEALAEQGVATYNPAGRLLAETAPAQLLMAVAAVLTEANFTAVARLLRYPDMIDFLARQIPGFDLQALLSGLDDGQNQYLPYSREELDRAVALQAQAGDDRAEIMRTALGALDGLLAKFAELPFPGAIRALLADVYVGRSWDDSPAARDFLQAAAAVIALVGKFESALVAKLEPAVAAGFAILAEMLAREAVYPDHPERAIDLQGWLELPWENAPGLVLAGMNDGDVPEAVVGDAFLPDGARAALGLPDNRRRFARDAFLFSAMLAARTADEVVCIVGRTDAEGSPLRPSRLFYLCADTELPRRAERLFREQAAGPEEEASGARAPWRLRISPVAPPEHLAVTDFSLYLQCPFRYCLRRRRRMEHRDDRQGELDPLAFGTLAHAVLNDFGRDGAMREADHATTIQAFLERRLEAHLHGRFGRHLPLAVFVQAESLRQRLGKFAAMQAAERAAGWRIIATETAFDTDDGLRLGGLPVRGRIDRLDEHPDGRLRALDYKTSDQAKVPSGAHLGPGKPDVDPDYALIPGEGRRQRWVDLQLPLYALMLATRHPGRQILCGYCNLPKAVTDTGIAEWPELSGSLLASARDCAEAVAGRIRRGEFWPPTARALPYDDFSELCPGRMSLADACAWEGPAAGERT